LNHAEAGTAEETLGDPRFFLRAGPFSAEQVAASVGAVLEPGAPACMLSGVAPLQAAQAAHVSFLHNVKYAEALERTRAGAVIISEALRPRVPAGVLALVADDPHLAWAKTALLFHPAPSATPGIHPTAVVAASASVHASAEVGPHAVVGEAALIGAGCAIGPGAVIGAGVVMGEGCRVGALASISHALLGNRVYVYAGARIGQEGFGFAITPRGFVTVPQLGRVILEDDVEIGANSTVDRGAARDTVIRAGSRIDNLVQIGHNVRIGRGCVLVAQSGVAGSSVLEDFVSVGAQGGISGHVTIGSRARVGAQCGVMSDVAAGADVAGSPAMPVREFFRNVAVLRRLARKGPSESLKTNALPGRG
jgi:UDP-3-O-[3-hydroxymyristoyl] glucosamine N-acyltransferase